MGPEPKEHRQVTGFELSQGDVIFLGWTEWEPGVRGQSPEEDAGCYDSTPKLGWDGRYKMGPSGRAQ